MCQQRSTEAWMLLGRVKIGGRLSMLKLLDVSFNSIVAIPEEIGSATSLVKFDCSRNHIKELPSSLGKCSGLSDLKASNNLITSLPEDLMNCSKLTKLDVEGNKLTALSENLFASWKMLIELNAPKNLLSGMPENIGCLLRLIHLDLHQNCCWIGGLSVSLNMEKTLNKWTLAHSAYYKSCAHESSLVSGPTPALLRYLRSRLSEGEDSEAKTPAKEVVTMAARLSLTSKELSLEGMVLSAVPSEVWESGEIIKVNLSRNSIQELPVELSSCVSLQIPSNGFQAISMLQILDLSGNATSLPENPPFSCLSHLKELYLRRMQLQEVPSEIISLRQLQMLDLSQNSLQSIPEGLKSLASLTELDLSDNNISALPPELHQEANFRRESKLF
ncbi:hypothetical protein CRYUN_Cryun38cG0051500 [Craigia yunnanensis]